MASFPYVPIEEKLKDFTETGGQNWKQFVRKYH